MEKENQERRLSRGRRRRYRWSCWCPAIRRGSLLQKEFSISRVSLTLFYLVIFAACRLSRMHPTVWSKAKGDLSLPKKNAAAKP